MGPEAVSCAVVFDCDGVLVDTQACWNTAFSRGASHYGVELLDEHLEQLLGSSIDAAADFIVARVHSHGKNGRAPYAQAVARHLYNELLAAIDETDLHLLPGVEQTLSRLVDVPRAVASNAPRKLLQSVLKRLGIDNQFQVILGADDVESPKPAPDIYLLACARLGVPPGRALALEDSIIGISAALAAGMDVLAVTGELAATPASLTVRRLDDPSALRWLQERLSH